MGRKKNPGYWERRAEYRSNTPVCEHCGKHNRTGNHKMCYPQTEAGKAEKLRLEQQQAEYEKRAKDRQFWNHPEAAEQQAAIVAKYGERPQSIADWWVR